MTHKICDACETVKHCSNHGCIPLQPAQHQPVAIVAVDGVGQIQVGWITKPQHNDKLYTQPPAQQEPVRIYDYVWPQRDEHKEECVYACSYTPGHHLARGELLAVVHPSQLKNAYLQRDGEAAHNIRN